MNIKNRQFFALLFVVIQITFIFFSKYTVTAAPTTLAPNDVVIVSASTDTSYTTGACATTPESNGIDLLLRVAIGAGTVIKITDNGWNGSALTTSEGVITYTAASDLPAGSVIRYTDCLLQTPSNGWTRTGGFDAATSGDTLLVYQGADTSPSFVYGFGFRSTSWINTGVVASTNSYVPAILAGAAVPAYATGTTARNYQYSTAGNYGIYSATFLTDLRTMTYWTSSGNSTTPGTMYGQTTVPFDSTRPIFTQAIRYSPLVESTNAASVSFRISTTEPVQALGSSDFSVLATGTVAYTAATASVVNSSTYEITVTGVTGDGTIAVGAFTGANLLDIQGNPADNTTVTSQAYTIDHQVPTIGITAPTKLSASSITDTTIQVIDNDGIDMGDVTVALGSTTAGTSGMLCVQTTTTQVDCTISIISSGDLTIQAVDSAGNTSTANEVNYIIDTVDPVFSSVLVDTASINSDTPILSFSATDTVAVDHYEVRYVADNGGVGSSGSYTTSTPVASPLTLALDPDEAVHTVIVRVYDTAGNYTEKTVQFGLIMSIAAPTTLSSGTITDSTVTITSPMGSDISSIAIEAGTTGASIGACVGAGGDTIDPYASPVTCSIDSIAATGSLTVHAVDTGSGASSSVSQSYSVDTQAPSITITAPTKLQTTAITDTTIVVEDTAGVLAADVVISGATTSTTSNFTCVQINPLRVDCSVHIESSGDIVVQATDAVGNSTSKSELQYVVDGVAPVGTVMSIPDGIDNSPSIHGTVSDPSADVIVTINGTDYMAINNGDGTWTLPALSIAPGLTVGSHGATVSFKDTAGNISQQVTTIVVLRSDADTPTVDTVEWLGGQPIVTGTYDPVNSLSLIVTVNGIDYQLGTSSLLSVQGSAWKLDLHSLSPVLSPGVYDIKVSAQTRSGAMLLDSSSNEVKIVTATPATVISHIGQLAQTGSSVWIFMGVALLSVGGAAVLLRQDSQARNNR